MRDPGEHVPARLRTNRAVRGAVAVTILALVASVLPPGLDAQAVRITDCVECDLTATLVVQLGTEDGAAALAEPARVARRLNGQWVVTDYQESARLRVFTPEGKLARAVGRRGEGPGEYDVAVWVSVTAGDSLRVADLGLGRITVLHPEHLIPVRTQRIGGPFREIAFLDDPLGRYVVAAPVMSRSGIGLPLHLMDEDGTVLRSFGAVSPILDFRDNSKSWRNITVTPDGEVWSSGLTSYVLERWSPETGDRLEVLERGADWFPPHERYGGGTLDPSQEPNPGLIEIHADRAGRLWTASHVAADDWQAAFEDGSDPYGNPARRVYDISRYYDTIVEVISPVDARVVGRARLEGNVLSFPGDGLVATRALEPPGYPVVRVWRIELAPQNPSQGGS